MDGWLLDWNGWNVLGRNEKNYKYSDSTVIKKMKIKKIERNIIQEIYFIFG